MPQLPRPRDVGRLCAVLCLIASAPLAGAAAFDLQRVEAGVYKIYAWMLITNHHVVDKGEKIFIGYRNG
jgi:hypothetical protein